jgi:thioredoxin reductase
VITRRLHRLEGNGAGLTHLTFEAGDPVPCGALFFDAECVQRSSLPGRLGCVFDEENAVLCNQHAVTNVPGVFIAGNVRRGLHLAITAAAEGVEAAVAINEVLLDRAYPSSLHG